MEERLFEELWESMKEAGAVLRGEREAARRTCYGDAEGAVRDQRTGPSGLDKADADV